MPKVVSYAGYKHPFPPEAAKLDPWGFWSWGIGKTLPSQVGDATIVYLKDLYGPKVIDFPVVEGEFDLAQVQSPFMPDKKPAPFVYTLYSDVHNAEERIMTRCEKLRPNFVGMLQYCPEDMVEWASKRGIKMELFPWFVTEKLPYVQEKTVSGFISGAVHPRTYPARQKLFDRFKNLRRPDVVMSCGSFSNYRLTYEQYIHILSQSKYYFSGGILDKFVPPKYYEVCNAGACLVSPPLPKLKECGFVDGETFIQLESLDDIPDILASDAWEKIGKQGRDMVQNRHFVKIRADRIKELWKCQ